MLSLTCLEREGDEESESGKEGRDVIMPVILNPGRETIVNA